MSLDSAAIIGLLILFLLMSLRMPIGFSMAFVGFLGFSYVVSVKGALNLVATDFWDLIYSYAFTTVPLFIFMGQIIFHSGVSARLYSTAYKWLGHLSGGLAMATIAACACFAAICGSPTATAASMATVSLPEMKKYNYDPKLATGSVAIGGTIGILIPPSITFIIYGIMVQESIGRLFLSGVFPGLLFAGMLMLTIYLRTRRNPSLGPSGPRVAWRERVKAISGVFEALALFILIMGGIIVGLFTPTEAAAVGALGALLIALLRRELTWEGFTTSLLATVRISCMVFVVLTGATIFGHFIAVTKIPFRVADWVGGLPLPPLAIMVAINFMYFIGGMLMESLPLIILTVPILLPICNTLGFDLIWFGVLIVIMCEVALVTPPVGVSVYVIKGIARDVSMETIFRGTFPFVITAEICIFIVMLCPQIALFLPNLLMP